MPCRNLIRTHGVAHVECLGDLPHCLAVCSNRREVMSTHNAAGNALSTLAHLTQNQASWPVLPLSSNLPSRGLSKETPGRAELGPYPISLRTDTRLRPHLGSTAAATGSISGQGCGQASLLILTQTQGWQVSPVTSQGSPAWSGWSCIMNRAMAGQRPQKAQPSPLVPFYLHRSGFCPSNSEGWRLSAHGRAVKLYKAHSRGAPSSIQAQPCGEVFSYLLGGTQYSWKGSGWSAEWKD